MDPKDINAWFFVLEKSVRFVYASKHIYFTSTAAKSSQIHYIFSEWMIDWIKLLPLIVESDYKRENWWIPDSILLHKEATMSMLSPSQNEKKKFKKYRTDTRQQQKGNTWSQRAQFTHNRVWMFWHWMRSKWSPNNDEKKTVVWHNTMRLAWHGSRRPTTLMGNSLVISKNMFTFQCASQKERAHGKDNLTSSDDIFIFDSAFSIGAMMVGWVPLLFAKSFAA